jgi:very-short-patch-repair endonuclease
MPTHHPISTSQEIVNSQAITPAKLARAKELRRDMTPSERKLWTSLRTNRLGGFHFRRQQVIEPYIVDFYCHKAALVIEVDGSIHFDQEDYDRNRDENLQALGLCVLRFSNTEINQSIDRVLDTILQVCVERGTHP